MIVGTILMFALPILTPIVATTVVDSLFSDMTKRQLLATIVGSSIILPLVVFAVAFSSNDDNGQAASWLVASIIFLIGIVLFVLTLAVRRLA
jgi:uncharacterized membrane protein YgdD (TMEM256/DUF423 family)